MRIHACQIDSHRSKGCIGILVFIFLLLLLLTVPGVAYAEESEEPLPAPAAEATALIPETAQIAAENEPSAAEAGSTAVETAPPMPEVSEETAAQAEAENLADVPQVGTDVEQSEAIASPTNEDRSESAETAEPAETMEPAETTKSEEAEESSEREAGEDLPTPDEREMPAESGESDELPDSCGSAEVELIRNVAETEEGTNTDGETSTDGEEGTTFGEEDTQSQTVTVTLNDADRLTVTIKGLSPESQEKILTQMEQSVDIILTYYKETGIMEMTADDLIDAEKYLLDDYDANLCWAATAANMLWTSNYAQQAVNPETGSCFKNVDEVFDYFRKKFKDEAANAYIALKLFFSGSEENDDEYWITDMLREDTEIPPLLPDEEDRHPYGFESFYDEFEKIRMFESLKEMSIGLVLHSVIFNETTGFYEYEGLKHSVTAAGIVIDENAEAPEDRYKAIIIADSDNNPGAANSPDPDPSETPDEVRAELAADAVNKYILYPLMLKDYGEHMGYRWTISYKYNPFSKVNYIIDAFAWLRDRVASPADEDDSREDPVKPDDQEDPVQPDSWESSTPTEQPVTAPAVPAYRTDSQISLFAEIRKLMKENDWIVYSPTDWNCDRKENADFHFFVRASSDMLLNVFLDDERVSVPHGDFKVIDQNTGILLIIFSENVMQKLSVGDHTLRLQLSGYDEIIRTLSIR